MLNVITAKFCSGSNQTWTKEVWQYDYGQVLLIEDVELPEAYEVHFSNMPIKGTAKPQIGNADGVTIPDEYFESGEPIYAWLFLHQGENDGETEKMITIPVKKRSKVVNEQPTPVEQSAINQAIAALGVAVEKTETAAEKAETAITYYPTIIDGTWHVWDVDNETWVDTGVQAQGHEGEDGISPEITVQDITNGHRVTITDATGTTTFDVMDGENGADGISPDVSIQNITNGHRVTITDAGGTHTFDVMNGEQGATGNGIASIIKTGTSGIVDTYTITYTNGQTTTFNVTNGSDATVTVDSALSTVSENPVQNKIITGAVNQLNEDLSQKLDAPETAGTSGQVLTSDGQGGQSWQTPTGGGVTVDTALSTISTNPVQNKAIGLAVNELSGRVGTIALMDNPLPHFELGNIAIGGSGWTYSSSTTRVRLKQGETITAYSGDIIGLTDYSNARYYLGWLKPDGTYGYAGWLTDDYTVQNDGEYVVLICNRTDTAQTDATALASLFKFWGVAFKRINVNTDAVESLRMLNPVVYPGVLYSNGNIGSQTSNKEVYTDLYRLNPNDTLNVQIKNPTGKTLTFYYAPYDADGNIIERITVVEGSQSKYYESNFTVQSQGAKYVRFAYRTLDVDVEIRSKYILDGYDFYISRFDAINDVEGFAPLIPSSDGYIPNIDTTNKTLTIYGDTILLLKDKSPDYYVQMSSSGSPIVASYSSVSSSAIKFYFNYVNKTLTAYSYSAVKPQNSALVCTIRHTAYHPVTAAMSCPFFIDGVPYGITYEESAVDRYMVNENVKSINHRGYCTVAPENTLPAYKLSKENGFKYVETDVSFTSDGVAVLLHDSTINRTARNSDGTTIATEININDITYAQALTYDFGIWKGSEYAGTKIPTLEQFLVLCRNLGLHPYIELKSSAAYTETQIHGLVDLVKQCGMKGNVTWISFNITFLQYVKNYDDNARLGFVIGDVTSEKLTNIASIKTTSNEVFADCDVDSLTDSGIGLAIDADVPVEIWDLSTVSQLTGLNPYVTGVTADSIVAGYELYNANK